MGASSADSFHTRSAIARRLSMVAAVLAPLAATACFVRSHPVLPMGARTDDLQLELESVRKPGFEEIEFTFRGRTTKPHTVGHGWLTVATRSPCSGGAEVDLLTVDGASAHPLPLPAGEHQIVAQFDRAGGKNPYDLVLDLELDEGDDAQCVRAPAISQIVPLEPAKRPMLVASMGLDATDNLSGVRGVIAGQVGAAVWTGPAVVTGLVGIASVTCDQSACGKDDDKMLRSGWGIPASLDVRYPVWSSSGPLANGVLSVGVRYSYVHLQLPELTGKRRLDVHGAQALVGWALVNRATGPFRHPERGASMEMTLPIGIMVDPDADSSGVGFLIGAGFRGFLPL